jgi:predicted peroxiredoxin
MADKLLIIIANADLSNGDEVLTPLVQATIAAAMEYEVEVLFTGAAGKLAMRDVAKFIQLRGADNKSVLDVMREAKSVGVKFKACTPAIELWGDDVIDEIDETVGGAYVITETMDDSVVTLTY